MATFTISGQDLSTLVLLAQVAQPAGESTEELRGHFSSSWESIEQSILQYIEEPSVLIQDEVMHSLRKLAITQGVPPARVARTMALASLIFSLQQPRKRAAGTGGSDESAAGTTK